MVSLSRRSMKGDNKEGGVFVGGAGDYDMNMAPDGASHLSETSEHKRNKKGTKWQIFSTLALLILYLIEKRTENFIFPYSYDHDVKVNVSPHPKSVGTKLMLTNQL